MKPLSLLGLVLLIPALQAEQVPVTAAQLPEPGQTVAPATSKALIPKIPVGADDAPKTTEPPIANVVNPHERKMDLLWYSSMIGVAGGTTFDTASSWHKQESNSLLASPNGTFGGRAVGIKIGLSAVTLLPQILLRKHKDMRLGMMLGNWTETGVFTGVAIHNLGVTTPK